MPRIPTNVGTIGHPRTEGKATHHLIFRTRPLTSKAALIRLPSDKEIKCQLKLVKIRFAKKKVTVKANILAS